MGILFINFLFKKQSEGIKIDLENFEIMVARINELKKLGKDRKLPQPLLNGNEVMEVLKMKPGAKVGEILGNLREKQLSAEVKDKAGAIKFIKSQ